MIIGLLMVADENDVLADTLARNVEFVDALYVLDGTAERSVSRSTIDMFNPHCYLTDDDLRSEFWGKQPRDGWRQALLERAYFDWGHDHWFVLLHGDELWTGIPDNMDEHDGFIFPLPFYFPREGEPWDYRESAIGQLRWSLGPGYPELRMFRGGKHTNFHPTQHFNVTPMGLTRIGWCDKPIKHYLYRSPDAQRARARRHEETGFDPDNYRHITDDMAVYWTDEMIRDRQKQPHFSTLTCDVVPAGV